MFIASDSHGALAGTIVQAVHELYDKDFTTPWAEGEPRLNRLIFIGRNLHARELERSFGALLA